MPKLGLGLGLSLPQPKKAGEGAAPAGIPVASTASVTVTGFTGGNTQYNGTYTKGTRGGSDPFITTPPTDGDFYIKSPNSFVLLPPSVTIGGYNSYDDNDYSYSFAPQGNWTISRINDDGEGATSLILIASNASSNNNSIPTSGWSEAITITAAPSGIPVTGASQPLVINFGSGDARNGTYGGGGTEWSNFNYNSNYRLVAPGAKTNVTWTFFDDDNYVELSPSNPSTDANFIPTSGWSEAITITVPAPSGIPVSTTNEIVLSGLTSAYFFPLNGTYSKSSNPSGVGGGGVNGNGAVVYFNNEANSGAGSALWFDASNNKWYLTYVDDNDYYAAEVAGVSSHIPFGGFTPVPGWLAYEGTIAITAVSETNFTAFSGATTTLSSANIESDILLLKGFKFDYGDYTNRYIKFVGSMENPPLAAWDGRDKYFFIVGDVDPNGGGTVWRLFCNSINFGSVQIAYYMPADPYSYWQTTLPTTGWTLNYGVTGSIIFRKDTTYPIDPVYTGTLLPSAVQGLKIWLKADTGVTTASNRVTAWADQSGSGLSVGNSGSNGNGYDMRPLLVPNAVNGYAVVRYDSGGSPDNTFGVPGTHSILSGLTNLSQTEYSFYIVQKFNSQMQQSFSQRHIANLSVVGGGYYNNHTFARLSHVYQPTGYFGNPPNISLSYASGQGQVISPTFYNEKYSGSGFTETISYADSRKTQFATSASEYLSKFRVLSLTYSASRGLVETRVDGVIQTVKNIPPTSLPNVASGRLILSKYPPYGTLGDLPSLKDEGTFQDVAEVVHFNRALSLEENAKIINGLKAKYNI